MNFIKTYRYAFILSLAALLFYSCGLGSTALLDPDEPVYGATAKEMVKSGSWLTPRLNGMLWFDKPPMYFWLAALSYKVFGINEFAARFPSSLMAAFLIFLVYVWAMHAFSKETALYSSLCLMSSLLFVVIGRAAVTDMTLCFFINFSFFMIYLAVKNPEEKFKYINWFYFVCGFSTLTKGPVGLVLPLMIVVPYLAFGRKWNILKSLYSIPGFFFFCLSALPWYAAMQLLHGSQFFNTFIGYHNLIRFLEPEHVKTSSVFFYVPVLIAGFFPHSAALVPMVLNAFSKTVSAKIFSDYIFRSGSGDSGRRESISYLMFICLIVFFFFSIAKTKLVTYILPMFPAFAILLGVSYEKLFCEEKYNLSGAALNVIISGGFFYAFLKVAPLKAKIDDLSVYIYLAYIFAAFVIANVIFTLMRSHRYAFIANILLMAAFFFTMNIYLLPQFSDSYSSKKVCERLNALIKPGEKLAYFSKTPSAVFYSDRCIEHVSESGSARMGAGSKNKRILAENNNQLAVKADNFVRNISPRPSAIVGRDGLRKIKSFLSQSEKSYVIMLASDYEKYSSEVSLAGVLGEKIGKYVYIVNH